MTTDEAAAYLGYRTGAALYQAVRRGIVPGHRLGVTAMAAPKSMWTTAATLFASTHPSELIAA